MAASTRVWLLAAAIACVLLVRPADADAEAPAPAAAASGGGRYGCNPLLDKTCKPGDAKAPENQEQEGGLGARLPSLPSPLPLPGLGAKVDRDGDGDIDEDDELPSFDTHKTILGH